MNFRQIKKILVIRLSSLGDVLLTTPLLRALKNHLPNSSIDFLIKPQYKDLLKLNPNIREVIDYDLSKEKIKILLKDLDKKDYDLIIDLQNNLRSKKIIKTLNKPFVKFNKRNLDKLLLVNLKINRLKDAGSIPERYAQAVEEIELDDAGLDLFTDKKSSVHISDLKNIIGFAPGARHFTKMWPENYYSELGNMLIKSGYHVVLFGGSSDKELCDRLTKSIHGAIDLSNDDDILQTAADMKLCAAIVCNDSGLMHTACAVNTPVMVFFGSTVREFGFTPYKNRNLILENNSLFCRPCSHIGRASCPKGHFKCMMELTPRIAFDNLVEFIKR